MAFALWPKSIRCPNCQFQGRARVKGSGCGLWLLWLVLGLVSLFFWLLLLVVGPMFLWLLLKPAKQVCPKCGFEHPIPQ
jgi:rubredoxin